MAEPSELSRVPDLAALNALVVVAQTGSMGAAAVRLGISQQAVSARVRSAEQIIGVRVFARSTQGASPTAAGRSILTWAQDVVVAASALGAGVRDLREAETVALKVAASNTISEVLLPRWAARFRAGHGSARLQVLPGNSEEAIAHLDAGEVDLAFVEGPSVPRRLASRVVARDELVLVVAPDHPWARRRAPISREELAETPLLLREPGSGTRTTLERALPELAAPASELGSTAAVRDAVLIEGHPSVLSSLAVHRDLEAGRLVRVRVEGLELPRALRALWPRERAPRGLAADLLRTALRAPG
ncbi:LysR family transcriptional regulator [Janibacter sp. GXQ6167]|uniref:LysR family transcriptional regulator n=1 Tax=Janibacter sp. GXQ6167 TaxID=3240791 RepID=UPI0035253DD0